MKMDLEFKTIEELYERVLPALRTKRRELKKDENMTVTEEVIWDYLKETVWSKSYHLTLADMVSAILKVEGKELLPFVEQNRR